MEQKQIKDKKPATLIVAGIITAVVVVILLSTYIGFRIYYSSRWHANTWVGKHDLSSMTLEESKDYLNNVYDSYRLTIIGKNDGFLYCPIRILRMRLIWMPV